MANQATPASVMGFDGTAPITTSGSGISYQSDYGLPTPALRSDGSGEALPGIARRKVDYSQHAVTGLVASTAPRPGVAFERFTAEGPAALLPTATLGKRTLWAIAGAARVAEAVMAAPPTPAVRRNLRRCIRVHSLKSDFLPAPSFADRARKRRGYGMSQPI